MEVTLERQSLIRALSHVYRVVEKRNTVPILANVLLKAEGGMLFLRATDLDLEVEEQAAAEIQRAGTTTVNAQFLHDIVRKVPEGAMINIALDEQDESLTIKAGRARFKLQVLPSTDFPSLSEAEFDQTFVIKALALKHLLERTQFAISTEETRYYLNGVHWHEDTERSKLRSVATDGHRLALVEMDLPEGAGGMAAMILPRKAVGEVLKLIEDEEAEIEVSVSGVMARFVFGSVVMTTKLIDGTFPDYERVVPKNNDKLVKADTAALAEAIDRVSILSNERSRAVKLSLDKDHMEVSVINPDSGTASEELEIAFEHEPMVVGVNARYILDVTDHIASDQVEIHLFDASGPILVRDPANESAIFVLMPMRV